MSIMFPIYFLSLILSAGMGLMSAYQILELSDLDCKHISLKKCYINLEKVILPELMCLVILTLLQLVSMNFVTILTTLPLLLMQFLFYLSKPKGYSSYFEYNDLSDKKSHPCQLSDL